MKKGKAIKRAIVSSTVSILLCVAMLIGTTFAWFTDTASTAVNKIQSGTLDVALEMKNPDYGVDGAETKEKEWISAEGKTLEFEKAEGGEDQDILWEPGCTYELPELRIVNNGNLALKYKVQLTGIKGDAKLNEAIEWTVDDTVIGTDISLGVGESKQFTIKGHMKEEAGNEYQELSIDGIGITVYATQDTVEYDSYEYTYDENSEYAYYIAKTVPGVDTVIQDKEADPTIKAVVPKDSTDATELALIKQATETPGNIEIKTGESAISLDVKIIDTQTQEVVTASGGTFFTIDLEIGQVDLVSFYHNDVELTKVTKRDALTAAGQYYYDFTSGIITYTTQSFSPFTAKIKYSGGNGKSAYPYLINSADQLSNTSSDTKNKAYFSLLNDIALTTNKTETTNTSVTYSYLIKSYGLTRTFNLSDNTITTVQGVTADYGLYVGGGSSGALVTLNANEEGGIDTTKANAYCIVVNGSTSGTKLNINGGTYKGVVSCVQVSKGTCTINGGFFDATSSPYGAKFTLNCVDANYKNKTAKIIVKGGTFVNFDPSNNSAEGEGTNFVADGYTVVSEEKNNGDVWYTVVKA